MGTVVYILSLVPVVVLLVWFLADLGHNRRHYPILWRLFVVLSVLVCASPLFIEYTCAGKVVKFDKKDKILVLSDFGIICYNNCANAPAETIVESHVQPITDNPKVRRITYNIQVLVIDWQKFFDSTGVKPNQKYKFLPVAIPETATNEQAMRNKVLYFLYEFNNSNSKELAQFYNPLAEDQRQKLEVLLSSYLNPNLEPFGLKMTRLISFSVD